MGGGVSMSGSRLIGEGLEVYVACAFMRFMRGWRGWCGTFVRLGPSTALIFSVILVVSHAML